MGFVRPLIVILLAAVPGGRPDGDTVIRNWLGDQAVGVLELAVGVDAKAVRGRPTKVKSRTPDDAVKQDGLGESIMGFPIYATAPPRSQDLARRLSAVLLDWQTYSAIGVPRGRFIKGCAFSPDIGFRVWSRTGDHLDLLISFSCNQVEVEIKRGPDGESAAIIGDVDPGRQKLVRLVKEALPNVAEIQQITERRSSPRRGAGGGWGHVPP